MTGLRLTTGPHRARRRACAVALLSGVLALTAPRASAQGHLSPRQFVQHTLRRFTYSDDPAAVSAVVNEGMSAWLTQQLDWQAIDDSGSQLEQIPLLTGTGTYPDPSVYERLLLQHNMLSNRQLQAKLELHWLDHFSLSLVGVVDPGIMYHYDQTVRANALGNFQTLLAAIGVEPAMLYWLSNNDNYGAMPNENFGREVMQLYSIGTTMLNDDGTPMLDGSGHPIPTYSEVDVKEVARAVTGYDVVWDYSNLNSLTRFSVQFVPGYHYTGKLHFLGQRQKIPDDFTAMSVVAGILAHHPNAAPFQVLELLKRFAIEKPSPKFVSDIVSVWRAQQDAPDQIAQVIAAIIAHPDFARSYHAMFKQPVEKIFGMLRQLPGVLQEAAPGDLYASNLIYGTQIVGQELFTPPSVFSFYYPGHLETLTNTQTRLNASWVTSELIDAYQGEQYHDTYIDLPALRTRIGATDGPTIAAYLLDALVDGGTPAMQSIITNFLGSTPDDNQIRGALWLITNSPDYAVN